MRIHILSDLHLEFGSLRLPEVDADVTVLAGDIGVGLMGLEWALQTFARPVVYVMGNHEFYGQRTMRELWEKARAKVAGTHVHLLENEAVEIGGMRFLGATLWTDFALLGDPQAGILAALGMNDYRNIATRRAGYGKNRVIRLTPQGTLEMHRESVSWLSRELRGRDGRPVVVVTHMAPHRGSLHPEFNHDPISPAFVSDLDPQVRMAAGLWIHGHTHDTFNYRIGKCRVVCNPRGYAGYELNRDFHPGLVVEV